MIKRFLLNTERMQVLDGKPYNRKCDVYSFGICLWEIYCCDMPYPNLSFAEVTSAVVCQVCALFRFSFPCLSCKRFEYFSVHSEASPKTRTRKHPQYLFPCFQYTHFVDCENKLCFHIYRPYLDLPCFLDMALNRLKGGKGFIQLDLKFLGQGFVFVFVIEFNFLESF